MSNLMAFVDDFLGDAGDKDPYTPNGLQVRGREEIKLLATGVSASLRPVLSLSKGARRVYRRMLGQA